MKIHPLLMAIMIIIMSVACNKPKSCRDNNSVKGDIIRTINVDCPLSTTDRSFIVENDSTYQQLLELLPESYSCDLPVIDFEKETLLGYFTSGNCEASFHGNVTKDASKKKYTYSVKVKQCGNCKSLVYSYNWVVISKLPADWDVEFRTE